MSKIRNEAKIIEFLESAKVLIVDKSTSSRTRLGKTMLDLGCKMNNIHKVGHLEEAQNYIKSNKPDLVLSDFTVIGGSGFDLFQSLRALEPETEKTVFVLITSNISQSAVAKAAEEDVDAFIIKPYTITSLKHNLMSAIDNKLFPTEYHQKIEEGKKELFEGDYGQSIKIFEEAMELSKAPSLALYYHGVAKKLLDEKNQAVNSFEKGLSFNHIHFKCQIGLYELFMQEKRYYDAYEIVKRIAKYFPSNPERLQQVIRLAVITENYEDMDFYYEIFKGLDERDQVTIKYICAGMYVLAKFLMQKNKLTEATTIFEKISISCEGQPKFLRAIIETLYQFNQLTDATKYISRFDPDSKDSEDFLIAEFLIDTKRLNQGDLLQRALDLYNKNIKPLPVFKVLVESMFRLELDGKAQNYLDEALKIYPDLKAEIKSWLPKNYSHQAIAS